VRDVILSPIPAALTIPIGIDAGRAAFSALRAVAERVDPIGVVGPTLERIKKVAESRGDDGMVLGFQPLEIIRRMLSREV